MHCRLNHFLAPAIALAALVFAGFAATNPAFADHHLPGCASDRDACILEAIDALEPGAGRWTKSGKPRVAAIEAAAGIDITGLDRDAAWAKYPAWKEKRRELDGLNVALASMTADRDDQVDQLLALQASHDSLQVELQGMDAELNRAMRHAATANEGSREATRRASAAEKKLRALMGGVPVCEAERAVVAADDSWRAKTLRPKVDRLLACLEAGES